MRPDYGNAGDEIGRLFGGRAYAYVAEAGRLDAHLVAAAEVDHDAAGAVLGEERLGFGGDGGEQGGERARKRAGALYAGGWTSSLDSHAHSVRCYLPELKQICS